MIRIFNIFGLLKNVAKIIAKSKGKLNTIGSSVNKRSLTDRLNKIKAKSKKKPCSIHHDEQGD